MPAGKKKKQAQTPSGSPRQKLLQTLRKSGVSSNEAAGLTAQAFGTTKADTSKTRKKTKNKAKRAKLIEKIREVGMKARGALKKEPNPSGALGAAAATAGVRAGRRLRKRR